MTTTTMLVRRDWSQVKRRALSPTEVVQRLVTSPGWKLAGEGAQVAIEKTYTFADYHETLAFVNAVAFIAHQCSRLRLKNFTKSPKRWLPH